MVGRGTENISSSLAFTSESFRGEIEADLSLLLSGLWEAKVEVRN